MNFKPGDLVKLKSGGPVMTVERVEDEGGGRMFVFCTWFDQKNVRMKEHFNPETLDPWN
jgi:uncharacterized protein YodC (DUF2158 family)